MSESQKKELEKILEEARRFNKFCLDSQKNAGSIRSGIESIPDIDRRLEKQEKMLEEGHRELADRLLQTASKKDLDTEINKINVALQDEIKDLIALTRENNKSIAELRLDFERFSAVFMEKNGGVDREIADLKKADEKISGSLDLIKVQLTQIETKQNSTLSIISRLAPWALSTVFGIYIALRDHLP